jgi:lipopolysaccharide export system protein LptA
MKQQFLKFIIITLIGYQANVMANVADDAAPLSINSDTFHFDNQTGIATYTGNVNATQGTRKLTGERLEIYRDAKTGKMDKIIVKGTPAHYQGLVEPNKPLLYAKANTITYLIATKFLTLAGNAEVKQDEDIYRAEKIEYDGMKETVYSPPSDKQQTTIILKGEQNADF